MSQIMHPFPLSKNLTFVHPPYFINLPIHQIKHISLNPLKPHPTHFQFHYPPILSIFTNMSIPSYLSVLLFLCTLASPTSAHFFPNASSIPPSLIPNISAGAWESFQKLAGCHPGEKRNGLAKLKQYFRHFGYLNKSSTNFTEEFDEALEAALKTYQLNYNLNVTGELDEATTQQILRPRCGVADIVNGTSTMNSGIPPRSASSHIHTVAHYSFFPGTPRWPSRRSALTYAFLAENQITDPIRLLFSNAFNRWSEVTTLTFSEATSYSNADIRIGFYSGDHGDGEPFDGVLGTLAHAFSPPSGMLHMDRDENWVIDGSILTSSRASAVDLESVAVHEIGHLLGLGHSSVADAVMYPTISSGTRKVELAGDDIEGIQVLYGSNPTYTGPTNPTTSTEERDRNGAHIMGPLWGHTFLLALLVVFML